MMKTTIKQCPKCGEPMEWEAGDPGEAPSWNCPMGGCGPTPRGWCCTECGEFEHDHDEQD